MVTKESIERQIAEMVGEYIENRQNYPHNAVLGIHKTDLYMLIGKEWDFNDYYYTIKLSTLIDGGNVNVERCRVVAEKVFS